MSHSLACFSSQIKSELSKQFEWIAVEELQVKNKTKRAKLKAKLKNVK
ncbi:transposase [Helicobacter pylori]|nr:transposase [Helicobacter pylori]